MIKSLSINSPTLSLKSFLDQIYFNNFSVNFSFVAPLTLKRA